ncbi:collagen-like protein [Lacticaseibacillus paracasei]|uniref:Tail host interaction protein n=1 Tax=Lacticaseibacillus paracasei (strain ATCC 334 / BCRC 17002 / CCUG 31169 / CIP 107868 / KCTC 3260 / NRRL B-441) TaxID=321967 RepID=Q037F0_LACP3|nr:collagen-like protein [Lacticaseibacillus paracasei]ABD83364.1 tail host interaction protein [Lacticaseibacillus paracasei ATCC 334]ABJ70672.1 hypothetical protein LSEI_1914 [Lacticaseibacillus paracasei ATCC 334]
MKDFYFVDRSWHLLGTATAGGSGTIHIVDDTDDQLISAGARTYSGTILFTPELSSKVQMMAARGNYILYMDERNKAVFMTIMESSHDPLAGEETFTAEDAGIDLINETVGPYKAPQAMGIADYISLFTNDSGFEIGLNEIPNLKRTLEWTGESDTTLNRILSVATQFDNAELDFSFDVSGTTVVRRVINIHKRIGADRNITLYVDKDINKIVTSGSIYDLYTAVTPTGGTPESKDGETTDQQPITLEGYQWTDPDGRYVLTKEGVLLDPVANQTWSRLLAKGSAPSVNAAYINRVVTYTATSQATLLQSALSDLKTHNHEAVNYETDIAVLPQNINIGDTIHLADENEQLYLSARLLELKSSYSMDTHTATLGDYLIEHDQVAAQYRQLAEQIKNIPKTIQYYPWLRYADDNQGTNMSALPAGKKYMAVVYSNKSSVPSDDPADYAGKWALIQGPKGDDGVGVPGPKGADGKTSYFHTAWANDVSGQSGFTVSGGDGKKYIGTYSDFTQADSTNSSDYNWALFKGEDGDVGPKGDQGLPGAKGADGRTAYTHFAYANSQDGKTDFSTTDSNRTYIGFYSDFTSGDSTNPSEYSWSLIKGADGANGKDGVPGKAGADGKTSYFHIAYADSSDGKTNFSLDTPGSRKYIGSYTDFTQADSTNPAVYSWQLVQGPKGDTGKDGVAGKDGVGIKSTQIMYAQSTSGTTAPTTGWTAQVPTLIKGQYLWTQTTWLYTDNTGEAGYTVSYNAKDGNTGANGIAGKDGVGIKTTVIEYAVSLNGVTKPSTGWSATIPSIAPGQFMWTRTTWLYTDGTNEVGYSVAQAGATGPKGDTGAQGLQGLQGPKGDQGIKGPAGADGKSSYTHIAYGTSNSGAGFTQTPSTSTTYIGMYVDQTATDSTDPAKYAWSLIKGADGAQGTPGKAGEDGKTSYFHIAYADSSDGRTNFSLDTPGSRKYIGSYTDFTQADSTNPAVYSWQLVQGPKGDTGVGIPGPKGADGKTSYFHTAYANSIDGKQGFSTTDGNGKSYFGQYVDQTQADSTDPTKYSWALFKGTDGRDGKDGSDNVPVITVGAAYPSGPKKGDMHWLTDSSGVVTGYYTYDGTKWNPYKIDAKILSAETFNGLTFNGVTFNGSRFITPFNGHPKTTGGEEDPLQWTRGIISVGDGEVKMTTTSSKTQNGEATATGLVEMKTGVIYSSQQIANSKEQFEAMLSPGQLFLSHTANNGSVVSGYIDTELVNELNARGRVIWQGGFYPAGNDTIIPSMKLSQTLTGWLVMWSRYENGVIRNNDYAYSIIPRGLVVYQNLGSNHFRVMATMAGHGTFSKTFWLADDRIIGDDDNKQGNAAFAVINNVFAI